MYHLDQHDFGRLDNTKDVWDMLAYRYNAKDVGQKSSKTKKIKSEQWGPMMDFESPYVYNS